MNGEQWAVNSGQLMVQGVKEEMKQNIETYKIWAPEGSKWADWAKPVLFAAIKGDQQFLGKGLASPQIKWISELQRDTVIIVDLPDKEGVEEGLALARLGWRPVPLYNGVNPKPGFAGIGVIDTQPFAVLEMQDLETALYQGGKLLQTIEIPLDAPPAFLLDSRRMYETGKLPGYYDNRWCVFPQDMPSADYLLKNNIKNIIVRSGRITDDLSHILLRYRDRGIDIFLCDGENPPAPAAVYKPSKFKSMAYRLSVMAGLRRNAAGGFGGRIPDPQSSTGVYHGG